LVAQAAVREGKYSQAFPSFGPERRGAPVMAFCRVDDHSIRVRAAVVIPDLAVVLDPKLLDVIDPTHGLKAGGILALNTHEPADVIRKRYNLTCKLALVDATRIAWDELKRPIANTSMLGALIKATGVVAIESMEGPIKERFGRIADINWNAVKRAFAETVIN
jgi:pyruvate ferredoxin oxidoreductase gamma subunit